MARFARHFGRSSEHLSPEHVCAYHVYPATEKQLSPSLIAVALAALRFLYHVTLPRDWNISEVLPVPTQPKKLQVVPGAGEMTRLFACAPGLAHHAVLSACYAAGLRIPEARRLRPGVIDSERMVIRVEQGKASKDR